MMTMERKGKGHIQLKQIDFKSNMRTEMLNISKERIKRKGNYNFIEDHSSRALDYFILYFVFFVIISFSNASMLCLNFLHSKCTEGNIAVFLRRCMAVWYKLF